MGLLCLKLILSGWNQPKLIPCLCSRLLILILSCKCCTSSHPSAVECAEHIYDTRSCDCTFPSRSTWLCWSKGYSVLCRINRCHLKYQTEFVVSLLTSLIKAGVFIEPFTLILPLFKCKIELHLSQEESLSATHWDFLVFWLRKKSSAKRQKTILK